MLTEFDNRSCDVITLVRIRSDVLVAGKFQSLKVHWHRSLLPRDNLAWTLLIWHIASTVMPTQLGSGVFSAF